MGRRPWRWPQGNSHTGTTRLGEHKPWADAHGGGLKGTRTPAPPAWVSTNHGRLPRRWSEENSHTGTTRLGEHKPWASAHGGRLKGTRTPESPSDSGEHN